MPSYIYVRTYLENVIVQFWLALLVVLFCTFLSKGEPIGDARPGGHAIEGAGSVQ